MTTPKGIEARIGEVLMPALADALAESVRAQAPLTGWARTLAPRIAVKIAPLVAEALAAERDRIEADLRARIADASGPAGDIGPSLLDTVRRQARAEALRDAADDFEGHICVALRGFDGEFLSVNEAQRIVQEVIHDRLTARADEIGGDQ